MKTNGTVTFIIVPYYFHSHYTMFLIIIYLLLLISESGIGEIIVKVMCGNVLSEILIAKHALQDSGLNNMIRGDVGMVFCMPHTYIA